MLRRSTDDLNPCHGLAGLGASDSDGDCLYGFEGTEERAAATFFAVGGNNSGDGSAGKMVNTMRVTSSAQRCWLAFCSLLCKMVAR
uniref:Uncharacterized protein n=1 Tax=Oryza brachyantha TaxID=4533 RepID=J3N3L2_ORYBR